MYICIYRFAYVLFLINSSNSHLFCRLPFCPQREQLRCVNFFLRRRKLLYSINHNSIIREYILDICIIYISAQRSSFFFCNGIKMKQKLQEMSVFKFCLQKSSWIPTMRLHQSELADLLYSKYSKLNILIYY